MFQHDIFITVNNITGQSVRPVHKYNSMQIEKYITSHLNYLVGNLVQLHFICYHFVLFSSQVKNRKIEEARQKMFSGERINFTEVLNYFSD